AAPARRRFHLAALRLCRCAVSGGALVALRSPAGRGRLRAEIGKISLRPPLVFAAIFPRMSRLASTFARARAQNRAAFVAYICAGDPDFDTSLAVCRTLL